MSAGLDDLIGAIPMYRWRKIRRRFEVSMTELEGAEDVLMVIAANEKHRADNGIEPTEKRGDDYDRFEAMTLEEITDFLGLSDEDDEDDSKSDPDLD